jgi:hypothetical protein
MKGKSTYMNYNVIVQDIKPSHYQIIVDTTVPTSWKYSLQGNTTLGYTT